MTVKSIQPMGGEQIEMEGCCEYTDFRVVGQINYGNSSGIFADLISADTLNRRSVHD